MTCPPSRAFRARRSGCHATMPFGLSPFDALQEVVEHRASRSPRAPCFFLHSDDLEMFPLHILLQLFPLRFNREDLVIFVLGRLPAIGKVTIHNDIEIYFCRPLLFTLGKNKTQSNLRDAVAFADRACTEIVVSGRLPYQQPKECE